MTRGMHPKIAEKVAADIAGPQGRAVIWVFPDEGSKDLPFAYTIGNWIGGAPELLLFGFGYEDSCLVLNRLSRLQDERGRRFEDGEVVSLGEGARHPVCVVDASDAAKERFSFQASLWHGGDGYALMQVVSPDLEGRFPWQKGCAAPYSNIKVHRRRALQ